MAAGSAGIGHRTGDRAGLPAQRAIRSSSQGRPWAGLEERIETPRARRSRSSPSQRSLRPLRFNLFPPHAPRRTIPGGRPDRWPRRGTHTKARRHEGDDQPVTSAAFLCAVVPWCESLAEMEPGPVTRRRHSPPRPPDLANFRMLRANRGPCRPDRATKLFVRGTNFSVRGANFLKRATNILNRGSNYLDL